MSGSVLKPLNASKERCTPVYSNCVVWHGPDIECINVCKGDTITHVIFELACLICKLKEDLDMTNYDLTCLELENCDVPRTWQDFIQVVINKLCEFQTLLGNTEGGGETIAQEIVTVAACFTAELGPTATLSAYVQAIGTKVCEQEITIQNQQTAITQILARLDVLES